MKTHKNDNGEAYFSKTNEDGETIFSFTQDFEDYWSQDDQDLHENRCEFCGSTDVFQANLCGICFKDQYQ